MVGVELANKVVLLIAVVIIEECKISFLAACASWPGVAMLVAPAPACGYLDASRCAPLCSFR